MKLLKKEEKEILRETKKDYRVKLKEELNDYERLVNNAELE